jgi:hypothetical protein
MSVISEVENARGLEPDDFKYFIEAGEEFAGKLNPMVSKVESLPPV